MDHAFVVESRFGFEESVTVLTGAIAAAGGTLFAQIDQAAAAAEAGIALRPTMLLLFGNPKGGTPVMASWPLAALELPLRALVWEDAGKVQAAFPKMSEALGALGVPDGEAHVAAMDHSLEALAAALR